MRLAYTLKILALVFVYGVAAASDLDIRQTPVPGEIMLNDSGKVKKYEDIVGDKDGIYRALTYINNSPALFSGSSHEAYHTLTVKDSEIFVDCIYFNSRSSITGVRITRGICGLNERLNSNYAETTYTYTNTWLENAARADISELIKNENPLIIYEQTKSALSLYETYKELSDLESASPASAIRLTDSCYTLSDATPYLIYHKDNLVQAIEIHAIGGGDSISIHTVDKNFLEKLDKTQCPRQRT